MTTNPTPPPQQPPVPAELSVETATLKLNERKVLYGLVAYPSRRDTDICAELEMKKSTFSTIKNRIEDMYTKVMMPGFPQINAELFIIMVARMTLSDGLDTNERLETLQQVLELFREDIYAVGEAENLVIFSISKNFTNYDRNLQLLRQTGFREKIFLRTGLNYHILPFETTRFIRFFSYAPLVNRLFELGFDDEAADHDSMDFEDTVQEYAFSSTEKKVFQGLLRLPDESNRKLAEEIGVSKNTLAAMKKKFLQEGLLLPRVVPDLLKIGIRLLVFFFGQFEPDSTVTERQAGVNKCDEALKPILFALKDLDFYILYAVTSFEEYHALSTQVMIHFAGKRLVAPNYQTVIFSLPHARMLKQHEYIPLVDKLVVK